MVLLILASSRRVLVGRCRGGVKREECVRVRNTKEAVLIAVSRFERAQGMGVRWRTSHSERACC
jgi:hypothetical protein